MHGMACMVLHVAIETFSVAFRDYIVVLIVYRCNSVHTCVAIIIAL